MGLLGMESSVKAPLPQGVQARIWLRTEQLFSRASARSFGWLWLLRDKGEIEAINLDAAHCGNDDCLAEVLAALDAEPENHDDSNAIRIDWRGVKLGYVPRSSNTHLAAMMDKGAAVSARLLGKAHENGPWVDLAFSVTRHEAETA